MPLTRIPYRNTGYFSPLICDLVDQHPAGGIQTRAIDSDAFKAQINHKEAHFSESLDSFC